MNELKTLKDLRLTSKEFFSADNYYGDNITAQIEKIRAEAVKWVKSGNMVEGAKFWVIDFFNLTEEDFKDE